MANGGSTVVEHLTHNRMNEGSRIGYNDNLNGITIPQDVAITSEML